MLKQELFNRIDCRQKAMETHSLDSYIITAEEDIWYFTNITYKPEERPFFLIVSRNQQPVLVVPKLEESHVYKGILDFKVITYWDYPSPVGENWDEVLNNVEYYHLF
jgi:Xaa-Pro dipeptidase